MKTVSEMAREAGIVGNFWPDALERFAEFVRADERAKLHPKKVKEDDYCQGDERYYANE